MSLISRKRMFVDPKVQGSLMIRVVIYWLFCVLAISQILLFWQIYSGPPGQSFIEQFRYDLLWQKYGIVVFASIFLIPPLLVDVVVISNRFVGPLYRLRRSMRALAAGEQVRPIHFRKNDIGDQMAVEFNALIAYVDKLRQQAGATPVATTQVESEDELELVGAH